MRLLFFLSFLLVAFLILLCKDSFFIGLSQLFLNIGRDGQVPSDVLEKGWTAHDLPFITGQTTEHRVLLEEGSRACEVPARRTTAARVVPVLFIAVSMLDLLHLA